MPYDRSIFMPYCRFYTDDLLADYRFTQSILNFYFFICDRLAKASYYL